MAASGRDRKRASKPEMGVFPIPVIIRFSQQVKDDFRSRSSGQDQNRPVKNFDPGRKRINGAYGSDHPLILGVQSVTVDLSVLQIQDLR